MGRVYNESFIGRAAKGVEKGLNSYTTYKQSQKLKDMLSKSGDDTYAGLADFVNPWTGSFLPGAASVFEAKTAQRRAEANQETLSWQQQKDMQDYQQQLGLTAYQHGLSAAEEKDKEKRRRLILEEEDIAALVQDPTKLKGMTEGIPINQLSPSQIRKLAEYTVKGERSSGGIPRANKPFGWWNDTLEFDPSPYKSQELEY